jgi:hypothetical protein
MLKEAADAQLLGGFPLLILITMCQDFSKIMSNDAMSEHLREVINHLRKPSETLRMFNDHLT